MMHPVELLRRVLRYEPETGLLYWLPRPLDLCKSAGEQRRWNGRYAGKVAFSPNTDGYLDGFVFRKMHRAHRVAWVLMGREIPMGMQIDHINGDRTDNRIENLRIVSSAENSQNSSMKSTNTSGAIGVSWCNNKWRATIYSSGKSQHIGMFETIDAAIQARKLAEKKFGFHENHGRRL